MKCPAVCQHGVKEDPVPRLQHLTHQVVQAQIDIESEA
jgi:hypothetical protein